LSTIEPGSASFDGASARVIGKERFMRFAWLAALVLGVAPAVASAGHGSGFSVGFGYSSYGSAVSFGYSNYRGGGYGYGYGGYSRPYAPVYYAPTYYAPPAPVYYPAYSSVYCPPVATYYPPVYSYGASVYSYGAPVYYAPSPVFRYAPRYSSPSYSYYNYRTAGYHR
jgi:hypothetical protein